MRSSTIQGQMWDQLALAAYGQEKRMGALLPANVEEADALVFGGNLEIEAPAMPKQAEKSLPPWERL